MFAPTALIPVNVGNTAYVDASFGSDSTAALADARRPYATIAAAITAISGAGWTAGLIQLSVGTFNIGTSQVKLPNGISLNGAGIFLTTILSTYAGTSASVGPAIVNPGNNSIVSNLTIQGTTTPTQYCCPIGCNVASGDQCGNNVRVLNVKTVAWSDGVYLKNSTGIFTAMNWRFDNCWFYSNYDTTNILSGDSSSAWPVTLDYFNCLFTPTWDGVTTNQTTRGIAASGGSGHNQRLHNCQIVSSGGTGSNSANYGVQMATNATIEIHAGTTISVSGSSSKQNCIRCSGTNGIVKVAVGAFYDPTSVFFNPGANNIVGTQIAGPSRSPAIQLTDANGTITTQAIDASKGDFFELTLNVNTTIQSPTNGYDGQQIIFKLIQGGAAPFTVTWGSAFNWGPRSAPTLSSNPAQKDYVYGIYNSITSQWDMTPAADIGFEMAAKIQSRCDFFPRIPLHNPNPMSNEINTQFPSGSRLYAVILSAAGQAWNAATPAFEAATAAHWSAYAISLTESTGTGLYSANFPTAITAPGAYYILFRQQLGGSPAAADIAAGILPGTIFWTGAAETFPAVPGSQMDLVSAPNSSAIATFAAGIWNSLTSGLTVAGSIGAKLAAWILGSDHKVLLSADPQTGVTIPTVTTLTSFPGSGSGPIAVNQNTGGTDNLRYVDSSGNGVEAATVLIYLATDWPTSPANVQAQSTTGPDGRWLAPAYVSSGTYVAVFTKIGADGPDVSSPFTV